jgi:hypothetical protein
MFDQVHDQLIGDIDDTADFGALAIKEVKLKKLPHAERLQVNDQRASIITVFLLLIFAEC